MAWLSVFKRKSTPEPRRASSAAPAADPIELARVRARRRLIGAALLLACGVIAFPLVFESSPRPLDVNLPIEIPDAAKVPPLTGTVDRAATQRVTGTVIAAKPPVAASGSVSASFGDSPVVTASGPTPASPRESIKEVAKEATKDVVKEPVKQAEAKTTAASGAIVQKPSAGVAVAPKPTPAGASPATPTPAGTSPATPSPASASTPVATGDDAGSRFIVQVGAFADPASVKDARAKVEKLGLKTYAQTVETPAGQRTRVRVGPFATREEAEKASARLKAAGLPAALLAL